MIERLLVPRPQLLSHAEHAGDRTGQPWPRLLPVVAVAALATALFLQTRNFGLIGIDSYPLIAASRLRSPGDLVRLFGEPLMHGYYPGEVFYRPLLELIVAVEHLLWGTTAAGYQATNVLVFAAVALALFALAARLSGPRARIAPWVALAAFAFHPLQYDIVPLLPRRAEALCLGFMALSLWLQLSPAALARRFPLAPAVAALAAFLSKETGLVLPAVSFVAVALFAPTSRFRRAFDALLPHCLALLLVFGLREVALPRGLLETLGRAFAGGEGAQMSAVEVQASALLEASRIDDWLFVCLTAAVGAGLVLVAVAAAWPGRHAGSSTGLESLRGEIVAALLTLAVLGLTFGRTNPWHLDYLFYIPMAGSALLTAALCERGLRYAVAAPWGGLAAAVVVLGLALAPWGWLARSSPLLMHYGEGEAASAAAHAFFVQARARIEQAPDGAVVEGPLLPRRVPPGDPLRAVGTTVLLDYSVQAWADLTLSERKVRVVFDPDPQPGEVRAGPAEVVLLLSRPQPGF